MNDEGDGVTKVRANRQAHPAVTKYRVLDSSNGCSLVELQPFTGRRLMFVEMILSYRETALVNLFFCLCPQE